MAVPIEFDSHPDSIVFARQLQRRDARTHLPPSAARRSLSPEAGSEWSAAGPQRRCRSDSSRNRGNDSSQGFTHMLCFFSFGASPISHGKLGIRAQARGGLTTSLGPLHLSRTAGLPSSPRSRASGHPESCSCICEHKVTLCDFGPGVVRLREHKGFLLLPQRKLASSPDLSPHTQEEKSGIWHAYLIAR